MHQQGQQYCTQAKYLGLKWIHLLVVVDKDIARHSLYSPRNRCSCIITGET